MGPIDAPRLHGKIWVSEDDSRTSFACGPGANLSTGCADAPAGWLACTDLDCDKSVLTRNLWTSEVC